MLCSGDVLQQNGNKLKLMNIMFSETVVQEIMDELGLEMKNDLYNAPEAGKLNSSQKQKIKVAEIVSQQDADLETRLNNLRRDDM